MLCVTGTSINKKSNINIRNNNIVNAENYLDNLTRNNQNNLSKNINHDNNIENINLTSLNARTQNSESLDIIDASYLEKQIAYVYKKNELIQAILKAKVDDL